MGPARGLSGGPGWGCSPFELGVGGYGASSLDQQHDCEQRGCLASPLASPECTRVESHSQRREQLIFRSLTWCSRLRNLPGPFSEKPKQVDWQAHEPHFSLRGVSEVSNLSLRSNCYFKMYILDFSWGLPFLPQGWRPLAGPEISPDEEKLKVPV